MLQADSDTEERKMEQDNKKKLVSEAKKIARRVDSWISLSNAITDPNGGLIARYFPTADQRQAFLRSAVYEELNQLLRRTIKQRGIYPRSSGGKRAATR